MSEFNNAVNAEIIIPINKSALAQLIAEAITIHQSAEVGSSEGQYSQKAKEALAIAIVTAQKSHNHTALTQEIADNAHAELTSALETFRKSVNTGVAIEITDECALRVYPTIATSRITVSAANEIHSISLISAQGAVITVATPHNTQAVVDITQYAQGIYTVQVYFKNGTVQTKIIVKR
ncbi:MAG: T9SS type A sorting domain-containing protein [Bacteroidales bacterium]|nr:T9SS type A sorting domain-containing protein [Bacteroidales bacterium]